MTETITFEIQGSNVYQVDFINTGDKLKIHCSCIAGQKYTLCKHRLSLINGITDSVVSDNAKQIETTTNWVKSSIFPDMLDYLTELEQQKRKIDKQKFKVKKDIARYMQHG